MKQFDIGEERGKQNETKHSGNTEKFCYIKTSITGY